MLRGILRRRYRYILFFTGCLYIVTSFFLAGYLEADRLGRTGGKRLFIQRIHDPFSSRPQRNVAVLDTNMYDVMNMSANHNIDRKSLKVHERCFTVTNTQDTDIDIEDVWDLVSVGYPKLALSVTGWIDTIKVTSWSAKPLQVIVVPHSHQDPGWLQTADSYYRSHTKRTLDLMVNKLKEHPSWKFIWSETVFLNWWWKTAKEDQRKTMRTLISQGQLELVTGGWVMPDEATTHYSALIDQLTEGHQWIQDTFNITVNTSWAIDPFGHSSTMPYIIQGSGIQNIVIQRTHFALKRFFAREKYLEFFWRQPWGNNRNDIFCHMTPFLLYSIPYSCGPDRHVCCQFDFYKKNCFRGTKHADLLNVTEGNIAMLAQDLWEQLQKKSELYRSNVVLMPYGDDFRYDSAEEWDRQLINMEKVIKYMNKNEDMTIDIKFGTLADYFTALNQENQDVPREKRFPALSGDFLTYSDRGDQYWAGYYTARPYLKYLVRQLQSRLRFTEFLYVFSRMDKNRNTFKQLESARRELAIHLHHDAITGTSRKAVIRDYISRLAAALKKTRDIYKSSLHHILSKRCIQPNEEEDNIILEMSNGEKQTSEEDYISVFPNPKTTLTISNILGHRRMEIIHVKVNTTKLIVIDSNGRDVQYQISPVWMDDCTKDKHTFILSFEVSVDPFSVTPYFVTRTDETDERVISQIEYYRGGKAATESTSHEEMQFKETYVEEDVIHLSNNIVTAMFTSTDGLLKGIYHHSQGFLHRSDTHFVSYSTGRKSHPFSDKSGAYIFLPDSVAKRLVEIPVDVAVIKGPVYSQVRSTFPSISHTATVFNSSGPLAYGVHIENRLNINSDWWNNRELAMRIETDLYNSDHTFCVDVNGFQLKRRKTRAKMTLQGNFHPFTTMAYTESDATRFTLITTSSHGVASLVSGWLEVVLDRRLIQDDWRGLNENVTDNVPVRNTFFLLFEERLNTRLGKIDQSSMCLPSVLSDNLSEQLNNPLAIAVLTSSSSITCSLEINLAKGLPCGYHILNFRMLPNTMGLREALVVIHHRGIDCDFPAVDICNHQGVWSFEELLTVTITDVTETSLTGTQVIRTLKPSDPLVIGPMEIKTYRVKLQ